MSKKYALSHVFLVIIFSFFIAVSGWAASSPAISITGAVRQPLNLTLEDLQKFEPLQSV
jgi:SNF family Na+-dependent transporter